MHVDLMYPSKYLKAADLQGRDVRVTISQCRKEELVRVGGAREQKWVIRFKGKDKGMVCNKTNARMLMKVTGEADCDNWPGWEVWLGAEPAHNPQLNAMTPALRFLNKPARNTSPRVNTDGEEVADDTFSTPTVGVDEELPPIEMGEEKAPMASSFAPNEPPPGALSTDPDDALEAHGMDSDKDPGEKLF